MVVLKNQGSKEWDQKQRREHNTIRNLLGGEEVWNEACKQRRHWLSYRSTSHWWRRWKQCLVLNMDKPLVYAMARQEEATTTQLATLHSIVTSPASSWQLAANVFLYIAKKHSEENETNDCMASWLSIWLIVWNHCVLVPISRIRKNCDARSGSTICHLWVSPLLQTGLFSFFIFFFSLF